MNREDSSCALKKASEGKKLAKSFFDFIEVKLHDHPDRYEVKFRRYWMWSELKQKMQEYEMGEWSQWYVLEEYVNNGIVYI